MSASAIIDMHSHICPKSFIKNPSPVGNARWPCMCDAGAGAADLIIEDKLFRKLDARSWDVTQRLDDMERDGVDLQVLSPMPELLSYWFTAADATVLCDFLNATLAGMISAAPTHFRGLGMVPLQDVPAAVVYLRRIREEFGLDGVEIGTHINGLMLGDVALEPFWEAAAALGLAVFIHPLHPFTARALDVAPLFHPTIGFPLEGAVAGGSLLLAGTLNRFPGLHIGLSHGGGALGPVIHRLDQAWDCMESFRRLSPRKPSDTARKFFYDSNVYDAGYLAYFIEKIAPGQVFLGTDYPYEIMQTQPREYLAKVEVSPAALEDLAAGAARRFLRMSD